MRIKMASVGILNLAGCGMGFEPFPGIGLGNRGVIQRALARKGDGQLNGFTHLNAVGFG